MKRFSYIINVLSLLFMVAARAFGVAAAIAIMFLIAAQPAQANDRENFSVGRLYVESDIDLSGGTMSNGTLVAMTQTDPVVNGRAAVLSSSATAERVIESGTATNGQIIVFTTPFTGNPQVSVDYTTMVATNTPAGKSGLTPTGFVAVGTATLSLDWQAMGTK